MNTVTPSPLDQVAQRYAVRTTPYLDRLLANAPPDDPLARQFRPALAELIASPDELPDPIGDDAHSPLPGVIHRYPDRVLLKPLHVCAAYCRFCFRREVVGPGGESFDETAWAAALDYIGGHPEVHEVILSGGDPLLLSPRRLRTFAEGLARLPHVDVLRVHTRLPLHDPERITAELAASLRVEGLATWVAVHLNHGQELTPEVVAAIGRMSAAGLQMISQTVLLRGVNDSPEALIDLFRRLVKIGVKPYALHHPDLAPGTGHFRLSIEEGRAIVKALHGRLSGLARPAYLLDRPGGLGKVPIGPQYPADWD